MDYIIEAVSTVSGWMRPYLSEIGLSMVATLLVIFGSDITDFIRKQIGSLKFLLKLTLFVLFCAFGFAFLTSFVTPLLVGFMAKTPDLWLAPLVIVLFYGIGLLAQKKHML